LNSKKKQNSIEQIVFFFFERLTNEFLSGLMRVQTDAFQIIQFILSFIHDEISAGKEK
jgi:hypothetical protein